MSFTYDATKNLVTALAEGLKSDTIPSKNRFREIAGRDPIPLRSVLKQLAEEMKNK